MSFKEKLADIAVTSITMGQPMFEGANRLSLEDAFDVADEVHKRIEMPHGGLGGYKIAWNTDALMQSFGLPHPGMGRVYKKFIRQTDARLALADFQTMMFEVEIVAVLGDDLKPEATHTADSVRSAVSHFTVGFELLNRLTSQVDPTAPASLAHNVYNAGAILGETHLPADELDISQITTRLTHNDTVVFEDIGKAPQDPFEAIAFLANHYTQRGFTMSAGHLVLCGSHIPLYPVNEPGNFSVSMSALGEASFIVV